MSAPNKSEHLAQSEHTALPPLRAFLPFLISLVFWYVGLLPDLFREGQGVVAEGVVTRDGGFRADNVLAKHDERYMPRDVADALKKQGVWQGEKK